LLGLVEQEHDLMGLEARNAGEMPVREDGAALYLGCGAMI
jgi:hypothetical protein